MRGRPGLGRALPFWLVCLFLVAALSERARVAARPRAQAAASIATEGPAGASPPTGDADEPLGDYKGVLLERQQHPGSTVGSFNITATYKGEWSKRVWHQPLEPTGPLQQRSGVAILKLRSAAQAEGGVVAVQGEMVLRDGQYVSRGDVMLSVQGVYVPAVGRMLAVVEPAVPIRLPAKAPATTRRRRRRRRQQQVDPGEGGSGGSSSGGGGSGATSSSSSSSTSRGLGGLGEAHEAEEAAAEEAAAEEAVAAGGGSALAMGEHQLEQREVLRAAARQVARLAAKLREEGAELEDMPDPTGQYEEAHSWRRCEFRLELAVAAAAGPAAGGGRGGGGGGGPGVAAARALGRRMVPGGGAAHLQGGAAGAGLDLVLEGSLVSHNCGTKLAVSLAMAHVEEYYSKAVNYTLMITVLGLAQVLLLVRQMEAASTPALASRVSLLTLALQAVLDAYLCLAHLTLGIMVESLFHSFGTVAFMQFVVFAIFEMRFLLSVSRARRGGVDPWSAQREVSVLYARFYAALLGGILATYQLQRHMPLLIFAFFSFWWPQIVLCVRTDGRQPLRPEFVLGTSVARLALPLYVYACPSNLLRVEPSPALCAALVAWVGLQCGLLVAQHQWGPRCFLPKSLLPRRYDYSRPVPAPALRGCADCCGEGGEGGGGGGELECSICLSKVDVESKTQRAVTPCHHVFHRACLEQWLTVKADCPTCRRQLPPL